MRGRTASIAHSFQYSWGHLAGHGGTALGLSFGCIRLHSAASGSPSSGRLAAGEDVPGHPGEHLQRVLTEDALRLLDIDQDVAYSAATTASGNPSSTIKPLDTSRLPRLQHLLDHAQDDTTMAGLDNDLRT